jgi:glycosyltransferase involved in cell wall biosynthesis/O-antigen ligase
VNRLIHAVLSRVHWGLYLWLALLSVQLSTESTLGFRLALSDVVLAVTFPLTLVVYFYARRHKQSSRVYVNTNLDGYLVASVAVLGMGMLVAWLQEGSLSFYVAFNKGAGLIVMLASFYMVTTLARGRVGQAIAVLLSAGFLLNLVALAFYADWVYRGLSTPFILSSGRLTGLLVDPNAYGGFLVVLLMLQLALLAYRVEHRRWFFLAGSFNCLLLVVSLVLTRSRGAWLALVGGTFTLMFLARRELTLRRALIGLIALALGAGFIWALAGPKLYGLLSNAAHTNTVISRWEQITFGLESFLHSPVWGLGLDVSRQMGLRWIIHNTYVWFLAEMGLIGFGVLLLLIVRVARNWRVALWSQAQFRAWAVGGAAASVSIMFLALGIEALYQRHLWLLLALSVILSEKARTEAIEDSYDRPARVLVVTTVAGTVWAFLLSHMQRLQEKGFQVEVACSDPKGTLSRRLKSKEMIVHHLQLQRRLIALGNLKALWQLVRLIGNRGYRIVHVHTPVASFVGRLAGRLADPRVRTIYTAHGFHFFKGAPWHYWALYYTAERIAARWTDCLIVMNGEDLSLGRRMGFREGQNLFCVHGVGVEVDALSPDDTHEGFVRRELGLSEKDVVVTCVAEFIPRKNHPFLLSAWKEVATKKQHAHLLLVGSGRQRAAMERMVQNEGIPRVSFLGVRRDVPQILWESDILVLGSKHEGLSRCIMEAMAAGKPVVATDVRGSRDLVDNEVTGLLVKLGDVEQFAYALIKLGGDSNLRKRMGEAGQAKIKSYDIQVVLRELDEIYGRCVGKQDQRP